MNPPTNVLRLIKNIASTDSKLSDVFVLSKSGNSLNRANSMGEALEFFIKDAFCGTLNEKDPQKKRSAYNNIFSWLGTQNNPPDIIIKGGDAVEVKKFIGVRGGGEIQLNSSYPKSKLLSTNPLITKKCVECEEGWKEKDIVYSVGTVLEDRLKSLVMVYGDCYAASSSVYENVRSKVMDGIKDTGFELGNTNELGRINSVDPVGITNLRIRGMWLIQNPVKVFSDVFGNMDGNLVVMLLMRRSKYDSMPEEDRKSLEDVKRVSVKDVSIQDPDNIAKTVDAVLISYKN